MKVAVMTQIIRILTMRNGTGGEDVDSLQKSNGCMQEEYGSAIMFCWRHCD